MAAIAERERDRHRPDGNAQSTRAAWSGLREIEPNANRGTMQDPAKEAGSRPPTDQAHAALWTGIVGAAKHLGKREAPAAARRPNVVQLKTGTAATPVYFIGAGLYEFHIAQLIASAHPVFAVEIALPAQWHDAAIKNDVRASPSLQEMVAPYVAALHAHVGATPCVIAGYSFHGSMAFEAAHQLRKLGGNVDMLMLLDAPAQYPRFYRAAWRKLREVWTAGANPAARLADSGRIVTWAGYELGKVVKAWLVRDPGKLTTKLDTLGRPLHWGMIERLYANSIRSYELRPLDCRGVVFRADRAEDCPGGVLDESLGWVDLFGKGLHAVQVTGDHFAMMREPPHDRNLAREMSAMLDRFYAAPEQRELRGAATGAP